MIIGFTGYGLDYIVRGHLDLLDERLTDALARDEIVLLDAVLEGLADLARIGVGDYVLRRDELLAASGSGPRGSRSKRVRTTRRRMQASVGPYQVLGHVHTRRDGSLADRLLESGPLIPLTDATIAYVIGGILEVRDAPVIYVNRDLSSWLRPEPARVPLGKLALGGW